jgi:hypothetical protein
MRSDSVTFVFVVSIKMLQNSLRILQHSPIVNHAESCFRGLPGGRGPRRWYSAISSAVIIQLQPCRGTV